MAASLLPLLSSVPLQNRLVGSNGLPTPEWSRWFQQLQAGLVGFGVPNTWANVGTFANAWAALGGGNQAPRYRKDSFGNVYLGGALTGGTSNLFAFTLPAGFRPDVTVQFSVFNYTGTTAAAASMKVNSDGTVVPFCPTSNNQVWLDGVIFLASK